MSDTFLACRSWAGMLAATMQSICSEQLASGRLPEALQSRAEVCG